ncbi:hypothetical protein PSMA108079_12860 [Pseudoalteromonas mariniglutinosa]
MNIAAWVSFTFLSYVLKSLPLGVGYSAKQLEQTH